MIETMDDALKITTQSDTGTIILFAIRIIVFFNYIDKSLTIYMSHYIEIDCEIG